MNTDTMSFIATKPNSIAAKIQQSPTDIVAEWESATEEPFPITMTSIATDPTSFAAKIQQSMIKPSGVDQNECNHEFEFIDCVGAFCAKCQIPYGVECLHPKCKVHYCTVHTLCYAAVNNENTFETVAADMTNNIYVLHLGHDGVIYGKDSDVRKVLSHSSLKMVEYCGYHTADNITNIFEEEDYKHITFTPIN